MISFIEAGRKRQLDEWKMLANVGYSAGMVGSMAFSKSRPRFDEIYNFPKEEKTEDLDSQKAEMLAWAANVNRRFRSKVKKDGE